jgi:hypothetical protein
VQCYSYVEFVYCLEIKKEDRDNEDMFPCSSCFEMIKIYFKTISKTNLFYVSVSILLYCVNLCVACSSLVLL